MEFKRSSNLPQSLAIYSLHTRNLSILMFDKEQYTRSNAWIVTAVTSEETKRWFISRKKEHMRNVNSLKRDSTALSKHAIQSEHYIDWNNCEILDIKTDYVKRKFIESYCINSHNNIMNDRNSVAFPYVYRNLFFTHN